MAQLKVSIVVPIYNVEPYVTACLQSVMRQTYKGDIECILVDDCGEDASMAVAERLIREYSGPVEFRILHHEHNKGLSVARNTGTASATGDYLYYLDSDDWISDDCIEILTRPLQDRRFDMVVGAVDCKVVASLPHPSYQLNVQEGACLSGAEIKGRICRRDIYVNAWNKLFRMDFIRDSSLSFAEGLLNEDEILSFQLAFLLKSMYVVHAKTYCHLIRPASIMRTMTRYGRALACRKVVLRILKDPLFPDGYDASAECFLAPLVNMSFAERRRHPLQFLRYYWEYRRLRRSRMKNDDVESPVWRNIAYTIARS